MAIVLPDLICSKDALIAWKRWESLYFYIKKESLRVKEQALMSASEAAEMIIRVDDIVKCAPRER